MLEIKDVCAGYGKKQVLDCVSAGFARGKVTVIIGPNGCGKSTLLKTLTGILTPFSGERILDKTSLNKMSGKETAKKISYLAQDKSTPDMTVEQMVLHGRFPHLNYPRRYSAEDKEKAVSAMKTMKIENYAHHPISSLSGGIKQSAYIAMALCQDTDYILLDEPTTYLDIKNTLNLLQMLKTLAHRDKKGIIIVMHDLVLALKYSDKVIVLRDGKIRLSATPDEVYNSGIINDVFGVNLKKTDNAYYYE